MKHFLYIFLSNRILTSVSTLLNIWSSDTLFLAQQYFQRKMSRNCYHPVVVVVQNYLAIISLLINRFTSTWDTVHLWIRPQIGPQSLDLDSSVNLTLKIILSKKLNFGHSFCIKEWIDFILRHITPLNKTSSLLYLSMILTLQRPSP